MSRIRRPVAHRDERVGPARGQKQVAWLSRARRPARRRRALEDVAHLLEVGVRVRMSAVSGLQRAVDHLTLRAPTVSLPTSGSPGRCGSFVSLIEPAPRRVPADCGCTW